jgi:hypothetical protein
MTIHPRSDDTIRGVYGSSYAMAVLTETGSVVYFGQLEEGGEMVSAQLPANLTSDCAGHLHHLFCVRCT